MIFNDYNNIKIRLTDERLNHIVTDHPEMSSQIYRVEETLLYPDIVVLSKTDKFVRIYYKLYKSTPVTQKYMSILVKNLDNDNFIITAYFTDSIKKGEILWEKQ